MRGAWEGAAPQDSELGGSPKNGKRHPPENTGLLEKVETTARRKVLKCSEHSPKFTRGVKLPSQIGSQSPEHADPLTEPFPPCYKLIFY